MSNLQVPNATLKELNCGSLNAEINPHFYIVLRHLVPVGLERYFFPQNTAEQESL